MDCKSCRWFEADPNYFDEDGDMSDELVGEKDEYGFCHRHAPSPKEFNPKVDLEVSWPLVRLDQWCGEWMPRKESNG